MKWSEMEYPWQVCFEEAWHAYCAGSLPIGAALFSPEGQLLFRGRNHINDTEPDGRIVGIIQKRGAFFFVPAGLLVVGGDIVTDHVTDQLASVVRVAAVDDRWSSPIRNANDNQYGSLSTSKTYAR